MNDVASLRFDRELDEVDRSAVVEQVHSRGARVTSWATVRNRTFARAAGERTDWAELARACNCAVDVPPRAILAIRPLAAARVDALVTALTGPGRPVPIFAAYLCDGRVIVELEATGAALRLVLAVVDIALAATPGRTVEPILPIEDELLASFVALRLRESKLTASRVLERYVDMLTDVPRAGS